MIEFLEIRDSSNLQLIGIIDTAKSIIWHSVYYGVGDFEIYVSASTENIQLLKERRYVTRQDDDECGIIEKIDITDTEEDGQMIVATGRFVKSILDRRIVYKATLKGLGNNYYWSCEPTILSGNVELAVRGLINDNAVNCVDTKRNIDVIELNDADIGGFEETIITDTQTGTDDAEKQVTYKNLLSYTDEVLQEYELGSYMYLDDERETPKFRYKVYKGEDRSVDSSTNEPVIFSSDYDNLKDTSYTLDETNSKNVGLIGGEGEGTERICAFVYSWLSGLERRETFIESDLTQEELTIEEYRKQLETEGKQQMVLLQKAETMNGSLDITNSTFKYKQDFNLGDFVTVEHIKLELYMNVRILEVTETQDDDGYNIDMVYGL